MIQDGTAIFGVFDLIRENPIKENYLLDLPKASTSDCCSLFQLLALANTSNADPLQNDVSGFLFAYNNAVTGAVLTLQRYDSASNSYVNVATLNDATYGTNYTFGFFTNQFSENLIGYQLKWRNVLTTLGAGTYRVQSTYNTIIGNATEYSLEYCLQNYSADLADGTIRFEHNNNGVNGDAFIDTKLNDYGTLNWYNSYRLSGYFGYPESTYTNEFIKYQSGQSVWVKNEQTPLYSCELFQLPSVIHNILRTQVMQADRIIVTDYNTNNADVYASKEVIHDGNYSPEWAILQSKLAPVKLKFIQGFNNLRKKRC